MSSALRISTDAVRAIQWEAAQTPEVEVCGLLLGEGLRVSHVVPTRNVASDPATGFEVDPAALIEAHRRHRTGKPAVIGCYHSHPTGSPSPSLRDRRDASSQMPLWIIATPQLLGWWRVSDVGQIAGFEPIACVFLPAGATTVMPSLLGDNPYASIHAAPS